MGSIKDRFAHDLVSALMQQPLQVWTLVGEQDVQRPLDALAVGDVVIVRAGAIGLTDIYTLGFDLRHLTVLDQLSLTLGAGLTMRPRWLALQERDQKLSPTATAA